MKPIKEEINMTGWELALVIMALTFMVVNVANIYIQLKAQQNAINYLKKFDHMVTKSVFMFEKMIDQMSKELDD